jgi:tetratricopeptide (TPR) repeat protein
MRRTLSALLLAAGLAACEPANDAQRLAMHWQACQAGLPDARIAACSLVIDAPNVTLAQKVEALIDRGALRAARNEDERAFADFGQALRFDARNAMAHIQRGLLHQKRNAFGPAIVDFVAADQIDDASGGAGYLGEAIAAQKAAYEAQLSRLDGEIAANPSNPTLYNDRCWLRGIIGERLEDALADCNRSLQLRPNSPEVLDSRGMVELKLRDYEAALKDYEAALADEPERGHYLYGRSVARLGLGMKDEAEVDRLNAEAAEPGIGALYESYGVRLRDNWN